MEIFGTLQSLIILMLSAFVYGQLIKNKGFKTYYLLIFSFIFIFSVQPLFTVLLSIFLVFINLFAKSFEKSSKKLILFWLSTIMTVVFWMTLKYPKVLNNILIGDLNLIEKTILMPLGISYISFRIIQYLLDTYRGVIKDLSITKLYLFIFFPPIFASGPIERYQSFYSEQTDVVTKADWAYGLKRILWGYFKKAVLLEYIFIPKYFNHINEKVNMVDANLNFLDSLNYGFCMYVYAYLDLSAYTDIAVGFSALFGFKIMENFDFPLIKKNISEFWQSWHISLSSWCRNNVYFPLFAITRKPWLGMIACMVTMGLWHNVSWNWVIWGFYHGLLLTYMIHWKKFKKKNKGVKKFFKTKIGTSVSWLLTTVLVSIGYIFVGNYDMNQIAKLVKALFVFS